MPCTKPSCCAQACALTQQRRAQLRQPGRGSWFAGTSQGPCSPPLPGAAPWDSPLSLAGRSESTRVLRLCGSVDIVVAFIMDHEGKLPCGTWHCLRQRKLLGVLVPVFLPLTVAGEQRFSAHIHLKELGNDVATGDCKGPFLLAMLHCSSLTFSMDIVFIFMLLVNYNHIP